MKLQEVLDYIVIVLAYLLLIISIWKGYNIIGLFSLIIGKIYLEGLEKYKEQIKEQKE